MKTFHKETVLLSYFTINGEMQSAYFRLMWFKHLLTKKMKKKIHSSKTNDAVHIFNIIKELLQSLLVLSCLLLAPYQIQVKIYKDNWTKTNFKRKMW